MPKKYAESEFIEEISDSTGWKTKDLYRQAFVNYKGETIDSKRKYTEILAEIIYNENREINTSGHKYSDFIEKVSMGPLHNRAAVTYSEYNENDRVRNEEIIAKKMFENNDLLPSNGEKFTVVDYQVPVIRSIESHDGKIDLILTNEKGVWIGELKDNRSDESLLRAVLEIETYYQKVSHQKLTTCYNKDFVGKAILLFPETRPFDEYDSDDHEWTNKLLRKLDILVFVVHNNYGITLNTQE